VLTNTKKEGNKFPSRGKEGDSRPNQRKTPKTGGRLEFRKTCTGGIKKGKKIRLQASAIEKQVKIRAQGKRGEVAARTAPLGGEERRPYWHS